MFLLCVIRWILQSCCGPLFFAHPYQLTVWQFHARTAFCSSQYQRAQAAILKQWLVPWITLPLFHQNETSDHRYVGIRLVFKAKENSLTLPQELHNTQLFNQPNKENSHVLAATWHVPIAHQKMSNEAIFERGGVLPRANLAFLLLGLWEE